MHILILAMSYAPDRTGIGPLTTEMCEHLAHRGHLVSVITAFPHYPEWRVPDAYRGKLWLKERINGVDIHRGYVYVPSVRTTTRRILYDTSIVLPALFWGLLIPKVDLLLVISPPLQLGVAGYLLARLKGIPFIFQIKDLVPDLAIALGMLRNRVAIALARGLERFVYARAKRILVICQGFRDNLQSKGVAKSKIGVISDWVDTRFIKPGVRNNSFRNAHDISEKKFLALHMGNIGAKQKLENIVDAAAILQEREDIVFVFVGDGTEREWLQEYVRSHKVTNIRFLPLQPKAMLPEILSAADVLLLNQSASVSDMVLPSKLLTYMASGRPVVAAVGAESEAAKCTQGGGFGLVVEPERPEALAQAIGTLYDDRGLGSLLGTSGRRFAAEHFSSVGIMREYERALESFVADGNPER